VTSAGQTFERPQIVRWGDSDPAGILYGPRAFEYGVGLVEDLFVHLFGVGFDGFQRRHKVLLTWVHLGCDFRRPAATGTALTLRLAVERLGTSSVTYRIDALGAGGETHFKLQMVSATVAMATGRSVPLVAEHRDALAPYVAR
jgi:4-hydroxybenzoyl-CoA thioesterase